MQKPGRNDPCPCGSGIKFKKCCLNKAPVATPAASGDDARRLRGQAELVGEQTESVHDMLQRRHTEGSVPPLHGELPISEETQALMALPEVQAQLRELAAQYWTDWLDTELPALKGQTPRQASTTPVGRQRLEALLADFSGSRSGDPLMEPDVD